LYLKKLYKKVYKLEILESFMDNFQKLELVLFGIALVLLFAILAFGNSITGFFVSEPETGPSDFILEQDIKADSEGVFIDIDDPVLSRYEGSESMAPVLGKGATGVGKRPASPDEIQVGDIVSFWQDGKLIVHRVIEKGQDDFGIYFITKGDNSDVDDGKVRFEEIDSVLVAIIY
jgi:hypothetical protein